MKFQLFYIILYYAAFEIIVTYNNKELRKLAPIKFRFKLNPKTGVPVIVNKFANDKVKQIIDITARVVTQDWSNDTVHTAIFTDANRMAKQGADTLGNSYKRKGIYCHGKEKSGRKNEFGHDSVQVS